MLNNDEKINELNNGTNTSSGTDTNQSENNYNWNNNGSYRWSASNQTGTDKTVNGSETMNNNYSNNNAGTNSYQNNNAGMNGFQNNNTGMNGFQNNNTGMNGFQNNNAGMNGFQNNNAGMNSFQNNNAGMNSFQNNSSQKKKKVKKSNGAVKKVGKFVGKAAVFGLIAGSVMYGVYYAGAMNFPVNSNKNYEIATVGAANNAAKTTMESFTQNGESINVQSIASSVLPAMVALSGTTTVSSGSNSIYGLFGGMQSYEAQTSGTGIIVGKNDTELLIVTNAHVIDDVKDLKCQFIDNESVDATVKGSKSDKDIAVVAVKLADIKESTLQGIAIAELADTTDLAVGQEVVAIGNALGEGQSVTNGIISAMDRSITVDNTTFSGLLMTNAAINSGNSGGALLNSEGKVIAINFAKSSQSGVEGMAYSIPISNVRDIIDSLMTKETRSKVAASDAGMLGIGGQDITSQMAKTYGYPEGVLIRSVEDGSAASKAGLGNYDIIVGFDNDTVKTMSDLKSKLEYYAAGETVTLDYYHQEGSEYVLKSTQITLDKKK